MTSQPKAINIRQSPRSEQKKEFLNLWN